MAKNKVMADLAVNIRTKTTELTKGLKKAANSLNQFKGKVKRSANEIKGGFKSAFSSIGGTVNPQMAQFTELIGGATRGVKALTAGTKLWKVAIASTGIGLLVIALGSLVTWLTKTKEGMRIVTIGTELLQTVFGVVIDRVAKLGGAIVKLFSGDFTGAWEDSKAAVSGFTDEIERKGKAAIQIGEDDVALQEKSIERDKQRAALMEEMGALRLKARDVTKYSAQERAGFAAKEYELLKKLNAIKLAAADDEIDLMKRRQDLGENTLDDDKELSTLIAGRGQLAKELNVQLKETLMLRDDLARQAQKELNTQKEILALTEAQNRAKASTGGPQAKRAEMGSVGGVGLSNQTIDAAAEQERQDKIIADSEARKAQIYSEANVWGSLGDFVGNQVTASFGMMADMIAANLSKGQNVLQGFGEFFKKWALGLVTKMLAMIATALVLTALLSALGIGGIGGLSGAKSALSFGAALKGNIGAMGGFANGGVSGGGMAKVGERGMETMFLPKGSRVVSHSDSMKALSGMSGNGGRISVDDVVIRGEDLRIILREADRKASNTV